MLFYLWFGFNLFAVLCIACVAQDSENNREKTSWTVKGLNFNFLSNKMIYLLKLFTIKQSTGCSENTVKTLMLFKNNTKKFFCKCINHNV